MTGADDGGAAGGGNPGEIGEEGRSAGESSAGANVPAFDQVTLQPKTVAGWVDFTRKLMLQFSQDVEQTVRRDLASTLAVKVDRVAVEGSGSGQETTGILNVSGIGGVALGANGTAPTWASIVELEGDVATANVDVGNLGYLTNAAARKKLMVTEKASGTAVFIWGDDPQEAGMGRLNGYRAAVSNNCPEDLTKGTGTNLSAII